MNKREINRSKLTDFDILIYLHDAHYKSFN